MRRISIWEALGAFAVAALLAFLVSGGIGLIGRISTERDNDRATADRNDLLIIEGRTGADAHGLGPASRSLRELLAQDPQMSVRQAVQAAAGMGNAQPASLNALVPSPRWERLAPLAETSVRDRLLELDARYRLDAVIRDDARPSDGIAVAPLPPYWTRAQALVWYLIGCAAFALIFAVRASMDRKHPILDAPWGSVPCLLAFAAAAPATLTSLLAYGVWRLFAADISWKERWRSFAHGAAVLGYRLRLFRRLPPAVVAPAAPTAAAPSRVVIAAAPVPVREDGAADAADETDGGEDDVDWYVIHPDELLGREHLLAQAGVPVFPIAIGVPERLKAVAVEASRIGDFERAFDLVDADAEDEETDIERTVRRVYDGESGEIAITHVPSERYELVERVLETVSTNTNGVCIAFTHMNGRAAHSTVSEDDWIEVFHYCAPVAHQQWDKVRSIYGEPCLMSAVKPSEDRGLVVKDADGTAVAQVVGRKVYLLCDLFALDDDRLPSVLARAIYDGVRVAEKNPLDDDEDAAAWRQTLEEERDAYVRLCLQSVDVRKEAIEREIAGHEQEIRECGQRITAAVRKRHGAVQTLDRLVNEERKAEIERLKKEFDQLAAAKPVLAVRAYADRIEVDTRTVVIPHMGRRYEIGRFRISIDDRGGLSLANLSNTAADTHCEHPHVRDRRPCLGNIAEALAKLLGDREYALAVNLLFRFLESYNPSHPFAKIEHWKEVSR